jgi:CheY-like chemotaxis protein
VASGRRFTLSQAAIAMARKRVLLAEDDSDIRTLLAWAMRDDGFEVVEAENGAQALACLKKATGSDADESLPDVIVSDIRMPFVSGLEVLEHLKRIGLVVPVVFVTAHGDAVTTKRAERLGAAAILRKPLDLDDFLTAVFHYAVH